MQRGGFAAEKRRRRLERRQRRRRHRRQCALVADLSKFNRAEVHAAGGRAPELARLRRRYIRCVERAQQSLEL